MSDGPTTVETLAGDPLSWPATLRDLLREASDAPVSRASLASDLADAPDADGAAAERLLGFLERTGIVEHTDQGYVPGGYGREYLDTHDESVVYEALAETVAGLDAVTEALAVRPLTDVEIADLLSATLDAEVDVDAAASHRAWLVALGYLSRENGVNELTRKGRRLVATTEGLTPPGTDGDGPTEPSETEAVETESASEPPTPGDARRPSGGDAGTPAGDQNAADATGPTPDGEAADRNTAPEEAERAGDESLEADLRERYDDTCMLCGDRRQRGPGAGHSTVHYLMPLEAPHGGPAVPENAVVVCPNHRADLEHGAVTVDPRTRTVAHDYEASVDGRALLTADGHEVGAQYLAYHNDVVASE